MSSPNTTLEERIKLLGSCGTDSHHQCRQLTSVRGGFVQIKVQELQQGSISDVLVGVRTPIDASVSLRAGSGTASGAERLQSAAGCSIPKDGPAAFSWCGQKWRTFRLLKPQKLGGLRASRRDLHVQHLSPTRIELDPQVAPNNTAKKCIAWSSSGWVGISWAQEKAT